MKSTLLAVLLMLFPMLGPGSLRAEPPTPPADSALAEILRRGELRVGLEAGYIPFEMRDRDGAIIGFDVDMARLMARELGVQLRLVNTQWDGIIPSLLTDKFDVLMSGMTITPERASSVDFAEPYITIGQTLLIHPRHQGRLSRYSDFNDPAYVVATKLGTTGDIAAREYLPKAQIKAFETEADAAIELRNGRADAFVYDLPYNVVYAARHPDAVVHLAEPFTTEGLGWAIRKNDPALLAWLNGFLETTRQNGTYEALQRKWFVNTAWLKRLE